MAMRRISVIVPTHNRADLLPVAITSIQNQTYPVSEIIIVSDGSTDDTDEVVRKMQQKDERIQLISYYPGRNGNYARNQGLAVATGEYIAFLDDDDEWLPVKTELQMKVFEKNPEAGLVYAGQNCIFKDEKIVYQTKPYWKGDLSERIFLHNDIGTPSQVIVKASVLKAAGNFDLNLGALQDYDLWIRCCQHTQVDFVYEPCINYYNSIGQNQVSANSEKFVAAKRFIAQKYKSLTDKMPLDVQKRILATVELDIAIRYLRNNQKKEARKAVRTSWRYKPTKKAIALWAASFVSYSTVLRVRGHFKY